MMSSTQRIRAVLFYLSLAIFFLGLPFILSFALGYKFNPQTLKFTKTGLIFLKTQPEGADIYLNKRLISDKTPASIHELLPGSYNISVERENYYPWKAEVVVEPGKVSRLDRIILFPIRPRLQKLNQEKISSFRVYPAKGVIYYLSFNDNVVYKSNLSGQNFHDVASLPEDLTGVLGWEVSWDQAKLFLYSMRQIVVINLESSDDYAYSDSFVFIDYPSRKVNQVFWHADSHYLIVITNSSVDMVETRANARILSLVKLNKENSFVCYDRERDALYFSDYQKAGNNIPYDNLYKIELGDRFYSINEMIKDKTNE